MLNKPITYLTPPAAPPPRALGFPDLRKEWRIARETARLTLSAPTLAFAPRGKGQPVMLTPGWQAPQSSMEALRRFVRGRGYHAEHWGLGTNRGDVAHYLQTLIPRVEERAQQAGKPVSLIGWSLGGVISREIAREIPDAVACVITFGSPVVGGPLFTATSSRFSNEDREKIRQRIAERERSKRINVPIATIFSRLDSIVHWPACIDRHSPDVVHYEVFSTHLSMGLDPSVWRLVADTLYEHTGGNRRSQS